MKKLIIAALVLVLCFSLTAQESAGGMRLGVQMGSDTYMGVLLYSRWIEASFKAQAVQTDKGNPLDDILLFGGHAGLLLRPFADSTSLSIGAELRTGLNTGDAEYSEYIDAGVRLGVNWALGDHCLLTGLLYPVWIETRETEGAEDWYLTATLLKTGVAVSFLF